jgi:hypothetical protein
MAEQTLQESLVHEHTLWEADTHSTHHTKELPREPPPTVVPPWDPTSSWRSKQPTICSSSNNSYDADQPHSTASWHHDFNNTSLIAALKVACVLFHNPLLFILQNNHVAPWLYDISHLMETMHQGVTVEHQMAPRCFAPLCATSHPAHHSGWCSIAALFSICTPPPPS